jgi:PAS domain S-box-containing protein
MSEKTGKEVEGTDFVNDKSSPFERLRRRAEAVLQRGDRYSSKLEDADIISLIHELEVHQIELQMQNEELRRTGKELEDSRRELVELYDSAPVGYLTLTPKGTVALTNLCAAEMLGLPRRALMHRGFSNFVHPADRRRFFSLMKKISASGVKGKRGGIDVRLVNADGVPFNVQLELMAAEDENGNCSEWRITITDIEELKRNEESLREANARLGAEIEERKRMQEKLALYTGMLEEKNRELQEFAFVASHDLQEPLRKIQAFGTRLMAIHKDALDEQGRDYLKRMQNAANRMQLLIGNLLEYSRIATRAHPFTLVDLKDTVQNVVGSLEVLVERTGGSVEIANLPKVEADEIQMHQLFQNLIGNALKFHKGRAPAVKIYCLPPCEEEQVEGCCCSGLCRIYVEDNGIGFAEENLERIFSPFQRLHGRTEYEGTGMGLAICRRIVERHGGSITAKSTPGKGSTFIVSLPISHKKS